MAYTRAQIKALKEDQLRLFVIQPLFGKMSFEDVRHNHGSHEFGKDFVMWKFNDVGIRENWAVVVKAGPISGRTSGRNSAAEVVSQVRRALRTIFHDSETNKPCRPTRCYIIASGSISEPARMAIEAELTGKQKSAIAYMDGDKLWEYVQRYLPASAVLDSLARAGKAFDDVSPNWRIVPTVRGESIQVVLEPKHPEAPKIEPLVVEGGFAFPDTPEGHEARESFLRHIETGAPAVVKRPFVIGFNLPDWFKPYLDPEGTGPAEVHIGPRQGPRPVTLRLLIETEAGERYVHERVRFNVLQQGTQEITLRSDEPDNPWTLGLVVNFATREMTFSYRTKYLGTNARVAACSAKFELGLSKGGMLSVFDAQRDLFLVSGAIPPGLILSMNEQAVSVFEKLALIQSKTGVPIHISRPLHDNELNQILRTAEIIEDGYLAFRADTITLQRDRREMERLVEHFVERADQPLLFVREEAVDILDVNIPLGLMGSLIDGFQVVPESLKAVQANLADPASEGPFDLSVAAGDSAVIQEIYERWLSPEDRARIPEHIFAKP